MIAKFLGNPADSDLPSFIQMGRDRLSSAAVGPATWGRPISRSLSRPRWPACRPSPPLSRQPTPQRRRSDLLRFVEEGFGRTSRPTRAAALARLAKEKSERLLKAKGVFDINKEWDELPRPLRRHRLRQELPDGPAADRGRRAVRGGRPGQLRHPLRQLRRPQGAAAELDRGWAGLLQDLQDRGLLQDTLVVWMGEVGRTPVINNRAGRDHWIQAGP